MPALVPQIGGVLETTPFARLLSHALDARFAGTLVLEESGGFRHGVKFEGGVPRKAKTGCPVAHLGEVLVESGTLTQAAYRETLERARAEQRLHGEVLLDARLLNERQLALGLREQLARQVVWMFGRAPDTRFGFFPEDLLENWGKALSGRVDALELIWRGIRDQVPEREVERALLEIGDRPIILREDLPLDYFFFMGPDRAVVDCLQKGSLPLSELIAQSGTSEERVTRVLCLLTLARALDLGVRSAPPLGLSANAPTLLSIPAPARLPDLSAQAPSAQDPSTQEGAAGEDHPEPVSAPPPSAGPRFEGTLPPAAARTSAIPQAATANLHLKQLARRRASRPDASEAERVHAAATLFERAEALASRGNLTAARRELSAALDYDPQPPYLAMKAWLDAQEPDPDLRRVARDLERAYKLAENHPNVRFYRGLVLQRLGKHASALHEFRFVVERLPRHIDAARQVRIYEARLRGSPKDRPSLAPDDPAHRPRSGLFSWLRKVKP